MNEQTCPIVNARLDAERPLAGGMGYRLISGPPNCPGWRFAFARFDRRWLWRGPSPSFERGPPFLEALKSVVDRTLRWSLAGGLFAASANPNLPHPQ